MRGVLVREIPVRLLDVSQSGCLLGATREVEHGTGGELRIMLDGKHYQDFIRVVRLREYHGASFPCILGGHFDWGHRSGTPSVRGTVPGPELEPSV